MTLEEKLKELLSFYTQLNAENQYDPVELNPTQLQRLDKDFCSLLHEQLILDDPEKEHIETRYRKLSLKFHPDRNKSFSPAIIWLENHLSERKNDGACFKALTLCYEKLNNPDKFKNIKLTDIKTVGELIIWLERARDQASTDISRRFYSRMIGLCDQCLSYINETGEIQPAGIRILALCIPGIILTFGTILFAEELLALYAVFYVLLKGSAYLDSNSSAQLKKIGQRLQDITAATATVSTTLLLSLFEVTFWTSRQCLGMTLQLFQQQLEATAVTTEALCRDLLLAGQGLIPGLEFRTPALKVIAVPLEYYREQNQKQYLGDLRLGAEKLRAIEKCLFRMQQFDMDPSLSIEDKIKGALSALQRIKKKPGVFAGKTERAVHQAEEIISLLRGLDAEMEAGPDNQLVVYSP